MKIYVFIIIWCFQYGVAQSSLMQRYTVEDGLSQNLITAITQDHQGFLWFGTKDGLNRFDGYSFRIFRSSLLDSTTLQSNFITSLFVDSIGTLWIGTVGGGLSRYNENAGTFSTWQRDSLDATSIQSNYLNGIIAGPNGTLIVSSSDKGISLVDTSTMKFSHILPFNHLPVHLRQSRAYVIDDSMKLWIGTEYYGLFSYNLLNKKIQHYPARKGNYGPAHERVKNIHRDSKGRMWIVHEAGFDEFINETGMFIRHSVSINGENAPGIEIREIYGDEFFVNMYRQCGTYNVRTRKFVPYYSDSGIPVTFTDRSGIHWLSTGGYGIQKYNPQLERFHLKREPLWFGLHGERVEKARRLANLPPTLKPTPHTMVRQYDAVLWFEFSLRYLIRYDERRAKVKVIPLNNAHNGLLYDHIYNMFVDQTETMWASVGFRLLQYDEKKQTFKEYHLQDYVPQGIMLYNNTGYSAITSLLKDRNGIIWLGTPSSGLLRFDEQKLTVQLYTANTKHHESLSSQFVLSLCEDPNDASILWIGTDGGGLNKFDTKSGKVTERFSTADILPNDVIYAILSDSEGKLWMSSNYGIVCFDPITKKIVAHYDANDGLQSNEFNRYEYWKDKTGKLYFGGINGWNSFYPEEITQRKYNPKIVFTDVKVSNRSLLYPKPSPKMQNGLSYGETIILQPHQTMIQFEFASLDYAAPKKNRYRYLLEGLNEQWIESGVERNATFTNLDPGSYRFVVEGTNSDGFWSTHQASIAFIILPPFYKTWWFQSSLILFIVAGISLIIRGRFVRMRNEQELQQKFSRQILEQQERDRERIASELHDSLGQNLLVVKNRAIMGKQSAKENNESAEHFENISTIISDTLKEVRTISHNLRPYQLDSIGLTETIRSTIKKIQQSSSLHIEAEIDDIDALFIKEQQINIFRIVQEAFNNVIKHSDATSVRFSLIKRESIIRISIVDNGKGIADFTAHKHGFGMMGMRERVNMLHGNLSVHSEVNHGTTINIELPV